MDGFTGRWKGFTNRYSHEPVETGVPETTLDRIADAHRHLPRGLHRSPEPAQDPPDPARRTSRAARASTGAPPRRWRSARSCWKARRCGSAARTAVAARSRSGTRS